MTTSEFYLETVAVLSGLYGLPGNSPEAIKKARDKSLTRRTLAASGLHQPLFSIVSDLSQVEMAIEKIGLPSIVKPADDSGSNDVLLCESLEAAKRHAAKILAQDTNIRGQKTAGIVLVEQYLEAPEFSVEMFSWQGETICIGITQKALTGFPYFVESGHLFPAPIPEEQAAAMRKTVRRAIEAVGIQNGATHTEAKWTADGCAIIEINARLAGGMIPELIRLATGIDMLEQQIRCAVDGPTLPDVKAKGVAGIQFLTVQKEGRLVAVEGTETAARVPGIEQIQITAKSGASVQPPKNAYDRLGYVIAYAKTAEETTACLQEAFGHLAVHLDEKGESIYDRNAE